MSKPIIIGIAGGSASGKTSISETIKKTFADKKSVLIIRQDDYYKDQAEKPMEERIKTNYDHPFAFDNDLLIENIQDLIANKAIRKPIYDFVNHTRSNETEDCYPCDVLILEGLFVLEEEKIQYVGTVKQMHEAFVEPSKKYADVIIPEGGKNTVAIDLLTTKISSIITHTML